MLTKQRLVLLDSDVVITLHQVGVWSQLFSIYEIWMTETMVKQEVFFYRDSNGNRIDIDLMSEVKKGRIVMQSVTASETLEVLKLFNSRMRPALHAGEIEALAVIHLKQEIDNLCFCTGDVKAMEALVLLGLRHRGVSLEELLSKAGYTKSIPKHFSETRFKELVKRASANRILGNGLS